MSQEHHVDTVVYTCMEEVRSESRADKISSMVCTRMSSHPIFEEDKQNDCHRRYDTYENDGIQ